MNINDFFDSYPQHTSPCLHGMPHRVFFLQSHFPDAFSNHPRLRAHW